MLFKGRLSRSSLKSALKSTDPRQIRERINNRVLELAIRNSKVTLAAQGLSPSDLSEEQLESLVSDEERKIRESFKSRTLTATLALLGLQVI